VLAFPCPASRNALLKEIFLVINLLSPELKTQIRYAKMNRLALRYARVTVAVAVVLAVIFGGALFLLQQQTNALAADVADKQKTIDGIKKTFLPKAKDASERLNAIKYVQDTQTRFSLLIADLSKVIPQGTSIDSMTLTGDEKRPMQVIVSTVTYDQVLALRNALITSPRVLGADIVSISATKTEPNYSFKATLSVGFKPGQAK
jgi:Tfp pilus assembly protein PilN